MNTHELIKELKKYPPDTRVMLADCGVVNTSAKNVTVQYTGWAAMMEMVGLKHEAIAWVNICGTARK